MSKRCPHCDSEIMPSVVKCRHCGRNVGDPPVVSRPAEEPAPDVSIVRGAEPIAAAAAGPPGAAAVEAALDPSPPPAGIAFKPPVSVVPAKPAAIVAAPSTASNVQDWSTQVDAKAGGDPYWQVKSAAPVAAAGQVRQRSDPKAAVSAVVLLVAGAVGIAASLQPWVNSAANGLKDVQDEVRRGFSGWEGKAAVALGAVCIILAILEFLRKNSGSLRIGLAAGLGIVAAGVYALVTATSQVSATLVAAREVEGMREDAARGLVAGWLDSGSLEVTPQTGLYVAIAAGVIAVAAGLLAMSAKPGSTPAGTSRIPKP